MLQQTRVAAVLPYYERFLARFPTLDALARAREADVLTAWSGLGYYSRARNLHRAARLMAGGGGFPRDYAAIRALPGVGDYTAAAVASIAFGLPYAVLDGNVARTLARVAGERGDIGSAVTRRRLFAIAAELLDPRDPGGFNQALMELGATLCVPREPACGVCPIASCCAARREGLERELPVRARSKKFIRIQTTLLLIQDGKSLLLWQRGPDSKRMAGFWELPEAGQLPHAAVRGIVCRFRHTITHHHFEFAVALAALPSVPAGFYWKRPSELARIPLSTVTRKALKSVHAHPHHRPSPSPTTN
jgi:A/G-specific adenine glycosylase